MTNGPAIIIIFTTTIRISDSKKHCSRRPVLFIAGDCRIRLLTT